ncbi:MAG: hypothetical protein Q7R80_02880 [bacterium]|nr:hypothetical protein [bacterium]
MRKDLEYLHDIAEKTIEVPAGHIVVIQQRDGTVAIEPRPGSQEVAREPFSIMVGGHEYIAVLKPGDVAVIDCPGEFKIPEGMCGSGHRRISVENRNGIGYCECIGRYVFDGRGWMGWADEPEWIDDTDARISEPPQPEASVELDSVHDHAAKRVKLPPGHYLVSQLDCYHPDIHPDPCIMKLNPDAYWCDEKPEEGVVYFGERVAILAPGDEITVCSDRTLIGYVRPEHYREELLRNINGRIERIVLQQHDVR